MANKTRNAAILYINGKRHEVSGESLLMPLSTYLRRDCSLVGTKVVCSEGDCGACTVLRASVYHAASTSHYQPINACIALVGTLDGCSIFTVEGLGEQLTPVQKALVEGFASQCGFCTPGFVMSLEGLVQKKLDKNSKEAISKQECKNALTGNLCRCTGYQQIIEAGTQVKLTECTAFLRSEAHLNYEKAVKEIQKTPLYFRDKNTVFSNPITLKEAIGNLKSNKGMRIIGAGTDLGVLLNKRKLSLQKVMSLHLVRELYEIKELKDRKGTKRLCVGARVTLEEVRKAVQKSVPEFSKFLNLFASPQIKNTATLVGNLCNASPIGDTLPYLIAMDGMATILSGTKKRRVSVESLFLGYRKLDLKPDEIVVGVDFVLPEKSESLYLFKASQRKDLDISSVNACIRVRVNKKKILEECRIVVGGVAATPVRLKELELDLLGKEVGEMKTGIEAKLQTFIHPLSDLRGSSPYRRLLVQNFIQDTLSNIVREPLR